MSIQPTEWQQRRDTLMDAISCTQQDINNRSAALGSSSLHRTNAIQTLYDLLNCLGSFGKDHFNYFHDDVLLGFQADPEQESSEYPPEHVLSVILDQISFDLEMIEQAVNQRLSHKAQVYETLAKADEMARLALKPVLAHFQLEGTRLVTYFQKSASIRVIPYASVALIGIPYTARHVKWDFLAIPHEVGHYLYWHGKLENGLTIQQHLTKIVNSNPTWLLQWLEEIFADVYGCLVAGPALALSFQDLQMRRTRSQFEKNDGEHPTPILRPDIYTKILDKHANDTEPRQTQSKRQTINWGTEVNLRWAKLRSKRSAANTFKPKCSGSETVIANAISKQPGLNNKPVDKLLVKILDLFATPTSNNIIDGNVTWWQDYVNSSASIPEIYQRFSEQVTAFTPNGSSIPHSTLSCKQFSDLLPEWLQLGRNAREQAKDPKPPEWLPVLHAGGWATRGPECEGAGTCGGG